MFATLFRKHCRHCFVSGARRNGKNGLLLRKRLQAASLVVEEGEVVGKMEADEWQAMMVGVETASDIESWEICDV